MDSMALCHWMLTHQIPFAIAHCNFSLRGQEADDDEALVRDYAVRHHLPFYTEKYDTQRLARENKRSIEEEARVLRYDFFERLSREHHIDAFLTAHHLDDQAETILMRIVTGSGLLGLQGIPAFRPPNYYRPLLHISRKEIMDYVSTHDIAYRHDSSNDRTVYRRNKIRHEILPQIAEINPNYRESLSFLASIAAEAYALLADNFQAMRKSWMESHQIDLIAYRDKPYFAALLAYLLESYLPHRAEIIQLSQAFSSTESKRYPCGTIWIEVKNGVMNLIQNHSFEMFVFYSLDDMKNSDHLLLENSHRIYGLNEVHLDGNKLKFPIILRTWRDGDKIRPIGMDGKSKKLSDLFQERKWTINQKKTTCILEDNTSEIIAILGLMSSENVKITSESSYPIKIELRIAL